MHEAQRTGVGNERFFGENDGAFLKGVDLDLLAEVLPDPGEVFLADVGQGLFEEIFMILCEREGIDELPHGFKSCEDGVLSTEGVFPEEDFKGCLILMLAIEEI